MRLSKIKLAGFKSFVDPTTFHLPSSLVGIVGPNGCGKSNVIDAVRWVMGEMSAKHLRGDSMADVIFNGSASRKPVGAASIELFFDNSDGAIGGQYAQYAEISLRRTISRDGTSSYFINSTRCRRKDITDIFLGTGLGSRSYAIIEQGMVSRLVDAKPDEMRVYVEEAAGISKYKERRRETETRIQHTRDNLARLNDLREEIAKQLDVLQRQARMAERYKDLKAKERRLEAELLALRFAELDRSLDASRLDLARAQTELEASVADQRRIEAEIVAAREAHVAATDAFNTIQSEHYGVQSEISRLEQSIVHAREMRDRQQQDLAQTREQAAGLAGEMDADEQRLAELNALLQQIEPGLQAAKTAEETAADRLHRAETALEQWQAEWHDFNVGVRELQQVGQVEQTRIEHLTARVVQLQRQRELVESDLEGLKLADLDTLVAVKDQVVRETELRAAGLQARLDAMGREADGLREQELAWGREFESVTASLASCEGQVSAMQAVQAAALGADDTSLTAWLSGEELSKAPRLAQQLGVRGHWLLAVETVLGDFLQAVTVESCEGHLAKLPETSVALVSAAATAGRGHDARTLLAQVTAAGSMATLLSTVFTAECIEDAIRLLPGLDAHQSVVTPDGVWLGRGWVRVNRGQRASSGLLTRENRLRELQAETGRHQQRIGDIDQLRERARTRLGELAQERTLLTQQFNAANRDHAESLAMLENQRVECARARDRRGALEVEGQRIDADLAELIATLQEARTREQRTVADVAAVSGRKPELQQRQEECLAAYNDARQAAEQSRATAARMGIEFEGRRVARESLAATLARIRAQTQQLDERAVQLQAEIDGAEPLIHGLQEELAGFLDRQITVDRALADKRRELEQVEMTVRKAEGDRIAVERSAAALREGVDALRMVVRETEIRRETVLEAFAANGAVLDDVVREMDAEADVGKWQEALEDTRRRIERLGPINLAAIEQFNEQAERKKYLDSQNDDLAAALGTLEQAIRKIDRETRSRFQETFDQINDGLKRIFPRLFGGGHAYLSLDGEDVLAAGVTVMARPPGKRNSHIHLLSGGEKALTAVALIFSIFELNPAPFCLLDEVDAPLDEANVGRFCEIVREMSQRVQFVVITHNKTTMEMVNQLTGVTMNEPGVSRLVSVDLDAAVQLAAS